jgi:hypothetical protein
VMNMAIAMARPVAPMAFTVNRPARLSLNV